MKNSIFFGGLKFGIMVGKIGNVEMMFGMGWKMEF